MTSSAACLTLPEGSQHERIADEASTGATGPAERIAGYLTLSALRMALIQRQLAAGLMHHSDQGSQQPGDAYQALLKAHGSVVSMNGVGSWYDNAAMDSFIGH